MFVSPIYAWEYVVVYWLGINGLRFLDDGYISFNFFNFIFHQSVRIGAVAWIKVPDIGVFKMILPKEMK